MTDIVLPNFDFSGVYYPQLLDALLVFKRINVPDLSDESPQEPLIQLLRAFALVGHLNNTLTDLVANESTLPTAQLVQNVRNMLRLIDYTMATATPAQTDLIYQLAQVLSSPQTVVPQNAQASSQASGDTPAIFFESLAADLVVQRTDRLLACFGVQLGVYADFTLSANTNVAFTPWPGVVHDGNNTREGDSLLFGHGQIMWDRADFTTTIAAIGVTGVWEYYDGNPYKTKPTGVVNNGANLTLDLTSYLGVADLTGTSIRVTLNRTGAFEDRFSYFSGGVNRVDTGALLGQSITVSININDYTVGSVWERFDPALVDGTSALTTSGAVTYPLPQTITRDWLLGTLNALSAFWMRFRVIHTTAAVSPQLTRVRIDQGKQYAKRLATQGQRQVDNPLGSSDGSASQIFQSSKLDFIAGTDSLFVNAVQWTRVDSFLASRPTDRHYIVELDENDQASFKFGDGVTGAIPPPGVGNIYVIYRFGAADNGNVGANTVTSDKSGLTLVNSINNPRPASGWATSEGSTAQSLEQAKIAGPSSLRTRNFALGPDDAEALISRANVLDPTVAKYTRARAVEEGFGPKTIELILVPAGGNLASSDQLQTVNDFFNGNKTASPPKLKRVVMNTQVTATNYVPRLISVTATVYGRTTQAAVIAALTALLQSEALKEDGVTFEWAFDGLVPVTRLEHEIYKVDSSITNVIMSLPAADVVLLHGELPNPGTFLITIVTP